MGFFDRFKKHKTPTNFFNFPQNAEGIEQVISWLKHAIK